VRRHGDVLAAGHPGGQIDVVGGQIHYDAHVGDPARERSLPPGDDLVHVAEFTVLEPLAQALQRRVVPLDVADRADQVPALERRHQPARGLDRRCQRLLDQRVHSGLGQAQAEFLVQGGRARDHRVVEPQGEQILEVVHDRYAVGRHRARRGIQRADQVHAIESGQHAGVVAAHRTEPDQPRAQGAHRAATVLTASTI
jgi:hypothetical protein